jgi:hypothetical protein
MPRFDPDFSRIRELAGDRRSAFEEFCAQLARHDDVPGANRFVRLRGEGGDGGVECYWQLDCDTKWGYQSKYLRRLDKSQLTASVETALRIHPNLTHYVICLPFNLTGPTGRRGTDQQARWAEYVAEWEKRAADQGMSVSFHLWPRSELIDRLVSIDPTGGRRRFWFNQEILGLDWFSKHIEDATSDAGPRYHPELNIDVPISSQLDAFGETPAWKNRYSRRLKKFHKEITRWRRAAVDRTDDGSRRVMEAATPALETVYLRLSEFLTREMIIPGAVEHAVKSALQAVGEAQTVLREELEATHGKGVATSAAFRQFEAEYQLQFPAADLDHANEIRDWLSMEFDFVASDLMKAIERHVLLITGVAGAGKTHAMCDASKQRLEQGLLSIVILGEKLGAGAVFEQIRSILGLPSDLSREALLAGLDAAAECSGSPLVLFVDALNERVPRNAWQADLPSLIRQVKRFPNLRVCLSCRSTFLDVVLPTTIDLPRLEHQGFFGVELDAILRFFAWWKLDPPAVPLLQPEYLNPLFLRMLCTGLSRTGRAGVTEHPPSMAEVVELFLDSAEGEAAQRLDVDSRQRLVHSAIATLVDEMKQSKRLQLPWSFAADIADKLLPGRPRSQSLLDFLLREGLLREVQTHSVGPPDEIMFGFERLGEFLLAQTLVREIASEDGLNGLFSTRDQIASRYGSAAGLNEALAILLPEELGQELIDIDPAGASDDLLLVTVESLSWRAPGSVSNRTEALLRQAIHVLEDPEPALGSAFSLAARASHPLTSSFLYDFLLPLRQADRDALLCPFLHLNWTHKAAIYRLCTWALEPQIGRPTSDTVLAWVSALAWICAAADRRPRDYATAAMVALLQYRSEVVGPFLDRFLGINDDYIIERVLVAAYGALIRANSLEDTKIAAASVHRLIFADSPPLNALIRDHGRCIIELAIHQGAVLQADSERYLPPYDSLLPDGIQEEEESETGWWSMDPNRQHLPKPTEKGPAWQNVWRSVDSDDFATYTMTSALATRRRPLNFFTCQQWIINEIQNLGFDSRFDNYDGYMVHHYGAGRSRRTWAERIGKKYQWIALYRLIGLISDNVVKTPDPWEPDPATELPPLQAPGERNLDPTLLVRRSAEDQHASSWWNPISFDFHPVLTPSDWLDSLDFPETAHQIALTSPDGTDWLTLHAYLDWDDRLDATDHEADQRRGWVQIRSYLVARKYAERLWRWIRRQDLHGRWMPEGPHWLEYVYAGEYPWASQASHNISMVDIPLNDKVPVPIAPTAYDLMLEFEFDCYHEKTINTLVPAPGMFHNRNLFWDGLGRYFDDNGILQFTAPALTHPGPNVLLAERESLLQWLDENGLEIVWTTLSEIHWIPGGAGNQRRLGYGVHSKAHRLIGSSVKSTRGVTRRV